MEVYHLRRVWRGIDRLSEHWKLSTPRTNKFHKTIENHQLTVED